MTGTVAPSRHAGAAAPQATGPGFEVYDPEGQALLGDAARLRLVAETDAHEGPVYVPGEDALYFTTLPQPRNTPTPGTPHAVIKRLALDGLSFPVDPSRVSVLPGPRAHAQRHDPRPRREPGGLRTGHTGGARANQPRRSQDGTGGHPHRPLGWAEAELAERRYGPQRRHHLVHRPELRLPARFPARTAGRGLRVLLRPHIRPAVGRCGQFRQAQRAGVLPRRADPLRHRQRRQPGTGQLSRPAASSHHGLRRPGRQPPRAWAPVRGHHSRVPRWNQGGPGGPRLCVVVQRGPGIQPGWRSYRPDSPARGRQLHLRRAGRRGPVHYHGHGDLGRCPQPRRGRPPGATRTPARSTSPR